MAAFAPVRESDLSFASNIVKGAARVSEAAYLHYLNMACGSARDLEYPVHRSARLGYLPEPSQLQLLALVVETSRVLNDLLRSLRRP